MNAHDHAAQLAEALRRLIDQLLDTGTVNLLEGENARAAWDKHNAPPAEQSALDL